MFLHHLLVLGKSNYYTSNFVLISLSLIHFYVD